MSFKAIFAAMAISVMSSAAMADGPYVQGNFGVGLQTDEKRDNQFNYGGALGYSVKFLRADVSYERLDMGSNGGGTLGMVDGQMASANVYLQLPLTSGFVPFAGVGVGHLWQDGSGARDDSGIAYIASAGLEYRFNPAWSIVGQYRFITTDAGVKTVTNSDNFQVHSLMTGLKFSF